MAELINYITATLLYFLLMRIKIVMDVSKRLLANIIRLLNERGQVRDEKESLEKVERLLVLSIRYNGNSGNEFHRFPQSLVDRGN